MSTSTKAQSVLAQFTTKWIKCNFCCKSKTPTTKFYYFACRKHIGCQDCCRKLHAASRNPQPRKLDCKYCDGSTVSVMPIDDDMPDNLRRIFEPVWRRNEFLSAHKFQESQWEFANKQIHQMLENLRNKDERLRAKTRSWEKQFSLMQQQCDRLRTYTKNLLGPANMSRLLDLSSEQIDSVNIVAMLSLPRPAETRSRSPRSLPRSAGSTASSSHGSDSRVSEIYTQRQLYGNFERHQAVQPNQRREFQRQTQYENQRYNTQAKDYQH